MKRKARPDKKDLCKIEIYIFPELVVVFNLFLATCECLLIAIKPPSLASSLWRSSEVSDCSQSSRLFHVYDRVSQAGSGYKR